MALVRRAINEIRQSWDQYSAFMTGLHELFDHVSGDLDPIASKRLAALLATQKHWDEMTDPARDEYSALVLYSSEAGYRHIFSAINTAFRTAGLSNDDTRLHSATFLVELLNIDLFHFRDRNPDADNFTGTVYRGMCLSQSDLDRFTQAALGPIAERYVSVPLAMVSATRNRAIAVNFALNEARRAADKQAILWEIDVLNLDPQLLAFYEARFPSSVVTSICAVPISQVSDFPEEAEVLLRGPHFQIVGIRIDDSVDADQPVHKIEAIMHNTNRDHLTAIASNVGPDKAERDLFRALILSDRFDVCGRLAAERNQTSDADHYRSLMAEQRAAIEA